MSHEIEIRNGRPCTFSVGEAPWHGLGKVLDGPLTAEEAIEEAGLNWEVELRPVKTSDENGNDIVIETHNAVVRTDVNEVLGVVGGRYHPLQNKDAFKIMDEIVGSGRAVYHTAGSLFNGGRVWMLVKLDDIIKLNKQDEIEKYILLTNDHRGMLRLTIALTPIRVVCNNTLNFALSRADKKAGRETGRETDRVTTVKRRHTKSLDINPKIIRDQFGLVLDYYKALEDSVNTMLKKTVGDKKFDNYITKVFEIKQKRGQWFVGQAPSSERAISRLRGKLYEAREHETNRIGGMAGTAWAAYNAVTYYVDHTKPSRVGTTGNKEENRLNSIWYGAGVKVKSRAFEFALA